MAMGVVIISHFLAVIMDMYTAPTVAQKMTAVILSVAQVILFALVKAVNVHSKGPLLSSAILSGK